MSVILLILKIIGWILLTLPALFLLIVFLVLVVPVRYRTDGSIEENIRVQGKNALAASYSVVWLFL